MEAQPENRIAVRIGINQILTFTMAIIGLFLLPQISWSRPNTNISIQFLLGLLALIGCAVAILRSRKKFRLSNVILYSAFLFLGLLHLIAAVLFIIGFVSPGSYLVPYRLVANIFEVIIFLALIASSIFLQLYHDIPVSIKDSRIIGVTIVVGSLASYTFYYFDVLPLLPPLVLNAMGTYLTIATISIALSLIYFIVRSDKLRQNYNEFWLVNAFFLLLFGVPFYLISVITLYQVWLIAILFLLFGFVSLNLGISIPHFRSTGMSTKNSFRYALILNLLVLLPFGAAFILEFFYSVSMISYELYLLIRAGAVIISVGIAILLYMYSKQKFTRSFIPLMLAFVTWVIVDIFLLVLGPVFSLYQESLVPYIVGYLIVFVLLIAALYWKQHPSKSTKSDLPIARIVFSIMGIVVALGISIITENWLLVNNPASLASPLDRIILICFSFLNVFVFSILGYYYLQESHGTITIEILGLSFLMLWIIPGMLKSIFLMWEWGWWAAEFLILGGLMVIPIIFGIAYLRALRTTEETEKRATLYADILAHDISNYHQAILTSLELIELEDVPKEIHAQALEQIHQSLSRADHLIKNVRRLGKVEQMPSTAFKPLDLVTYITLAFDQVTHALGDDKFTLKCNRSEGQCYADANLLLVDLFQNLIRNAIEYSNDKKMVEVKIKLLENRDRPWWEIQIIDFGRGISPERKAQLFNRYMDSAHGTGLGLSVVRALSEAFGGWVAVQDRVPRQYEKGTVFLVYLPVSSSKPP
ncbi:MAG: sensor histidine kinase [Candidatus Thorarchaeota archaeon]